MNAERKKRKGCGSCLVASLIGSLLLALPVLWFIFGDLIADLAHRKKFDAVMWQRDDRGIQSPNWPPRLCMVDDLIRSDRLIDLTSNEVVNLLGPPHSKSFPAGAAQCDIHYYLGPERGFIRIDSEWLFLKLGPDGKVNRQWLYTD